MSSSPFAKVRSRLSFIVVAAVAVMSGTSRLHAVSSAPPPDPYQLVHAFSFATPEESINGLAPGTPVVFGSDGSLYGTTQFGGGDDCGTAYKISAEGTFTLLHEFASDVDGCTPTGLLLVDEVLYGMTSFHDSGSGAIFSMTTAGVVTVLHVFDGTDGGRPAYPLVESCGVLYGTTTTGGTYNEGVAFLFAEGNLEVLHHFGDSEGDASEPSSGLLMASDGMFYGTSFDGGTPSAGTRAGTVYRMNGTGDVEVLISFDLDGPLGEFPVGGVVQTGPTTFFGVTSSLQNFFSSTPTRMGGLFKLETDPLAVEVLHTFSPNPLDLDGALPYGSLIVASDGNVYGTTIGGGGTAVELGGGTVFRFAVATETFEILHRFEGANADPSFYPVAGLTEGPDSQLYGTTGGVIALEVPLPVAGTVFKLNVGITTKTPQAITFDPLGNKVFGDPDFTVSASTTSPLTVTFSAEGDCTVTAGLVHLTGVGSCTITASQAGDETYEAAESVNQSFDITPNPGVTLTIAQASVIGGTNAQATVTIPNPAPNAGVVVTLTSDTTSAATVPATVTIPKGKTSKNFNITTIPVSTDAIVHIGASVGGPEAIQPLGVLAPRVTKVMLNPAAVVGGSPSTGTVTISGKAPVGGMSVGLESDTPAVASVGAAVIVPAGATSATFPIATVAVGSDTPAGIGASTDTCDFREAILTVKAASLSKLDVAPASVPRNTSSFGTVTLNGPAPTGGASVTVTTNNPIAWLAAPVVVPAGLTTVTFEIFTIPNNSGAGGLAPTPQPPAPGGAGSTVVVISATFNGVTKTKNLTVTSSVLASVTLNPATVKGGVPTTATVTLTEPAPAGGLLVTLTSDKPAAAASTTVTVAAGATTANTTITTFAVAGKTTVKITGEGGGVTKTATLTVNK